MLIISIANELNSAVCFLATNQPGICHDTWRLSFLILSSSVILYVFLFESSI